MASDGIQSDLLEQIRKRLPVNVSLVDSVAELLAVSRDSVYRRMRGETVLSLDEAKKLCDFFNLSIDSILSPNSQIVPFKHLVVNNTPETFERWLQSMLTNLDLIYHSTDEKEIIYSAKDVPVFYYFDFPELRAFKMFFWMKSVLRYSIYEAEKFDTTLVPDRYEQLAEKIWKRYSAIPSVELWSDETINVTLKQIEFYFECGFFKSREHALQLCDQYAELIDLIRNQAARGYKAEGCSFKLYKNEILIADNTLIFKVGDERSVFITHNITEILMTRHENFCNQTEHFINTLLNTSILISTTGEKERNKFFNQINQKIECLKDRLI
jgi:hypothetical protein